MRVPLVLLPGMSCSARLWADVTRRLDDGRTLMPEPLDRPRVDEQVDSMLAALPPRFALAGLSLGAIVAMAIHRRAPQRVAGLLLVSTNARPPTDGQRAAWAAQLERLAAGASARELQEELLPGLVGAGAAPELRRTTLEMADEVGAATVAAQLRLQADRVDERPALRTVDVPCTVVAAADDAICPLDRHTEIHGLVPGSELVVVPGAPHLVTLSHPRDVSDAARSWLEQVDG